MCKFQGNEPKLKEKTFSEVLSSPSVQTDVKIKPALTMCLSLLPYSSALTPYSGFFWTFRKKLKAKKTQAEKKLKQIIQKLNNLPTQN